MSFAPSRLILQVVSAAAAVAAALALWFANGQFHPVEPKTVGIKSDAGLLTGQACAACHQEQFNSLRNAPHWNTLTPAVQVTPERFADKSFAVSGESSEYRFFERDGRLWCQSNRVAEPLAIDWVFGSGSHAQTPVSIQTNARERLEAIEHRVSWYPGHGLGLTLGQDEVNSTGQLRVGMEHHGTRHDPIDTLDCFTCHSERLDPTALQDPKRVATGLGCLRCHVQGEEHANLQNGESARLVEDSFVWSRLSARDSVNRCGECHRRADQLPADEITIEMEHIVRFAPVGLVQSACFLASERDSKMRLDCMTCHDPHQAASRDPAFYAQKCRTCHSPDDASQVHCSEQPSSDRCIACHMPKRETQPLLYFTDHWIRRKPTAAQLPVEDSPADNSSK